MKRFTALLLAVVLMGLLCSSAMATSFSATLDCTENKTYTSLGSWDASSGKTGKIYIYHSVSTSGVPTLYTNHFRLYVDGATSANNNKWITPGSNTEVLCSAIKSTSKVKVTARGNTYYKDDGFNSISVKGTMGWPL